MAYRLSATKLNSYRRCPQAYYFQYERKLSGQSAFGSPALGNALHKALAVFYQDWNYGIPIPKRSWLHVCWEACSRELDPRNQAEGLKRLNQYYDRFVLAIGDMAKPLGIEQWIKAQIAFNNVEFMLTGKYDRLDYFNGGLALIDYKSGEPPNYVEEPDLQLGFYDLILEQTYQKSLSEWRLIYLKTGEEVIYRVTDDHRAKVRSLISNLSMSLKNDQTWSPCTGDHCDRCSYQRYCSERTPQPEPLPTNVGKPENLQFTLDFSSIAATQASLSEEHDRSLEAEWQSKKREKAIAPQGQLSLNL